MQRATTATAQPSATDVYALGRDPGETARLQRQSEELVSRERGSFTGLAARE